MMMQTLMSYLLADSSARASTPHRTRPFVYLMYKARGKSTEDFLQLFSKHDLASNDDKVGDILEDIVENEIKAFE